MDMVKMYPRYLPQWDEHGLGLDLVRRPMQELFCLVPRCYSCGWLWLLVPAR